MELIIKNNSMENATIIQAVSKCGLYIYPIYT